MKLAQIENNIVINIIEVDDDPTLIPEWAKKWPKIENGGIGWEYKKGKFVAPKDISEDLELADEIRKQRNALLKESDWTQLQDSKVNKDEWMSYRQKLRDITEQDGFPEKITWPTRPK